MEDQMKQLDLLKIPNCSFNESTQWKNSLKDKILKGNHKIMSKGDVINFMQTYQRITQNMFKNMPKYASIIFNLNSNHQIKSAVYKK